MTMVVNEAGDGGHTLRVDGLGTADLRCRAFAYRSDLAVMDDDRAMLDHLSGGDDAGVCDDEVLR